MILPARALSRLRRLFLFIVENQIPFDPSSQFFR